jgi:vacuolar protein sorting-associated protein 33A
MASAVSGVSGNPSRLASSPLKLISLRNDAYQEFIAILDGMPRGRTTVVVDPNLVSPLKLVAAEGSKILEEHRVASIMGLVSADVSAATENVLYLTRPTLQHVKLIASQIKRMQRAPHVPSIHLYFVPRRTFVCDEALKEEGG